LDYHLFQKFGKGVTHCWFRSFWQAYDYFGLRLHLDYHLIRISRERDLLLVYLFFDSGWEIDDFLSWNRCRIACRALFLSDICGTDGKGIDPRYLSDLVLSDSPLSLSAYNFGKERPSKADWEVWTRFWTQTYPGWVLPICQGPWICASHRPNECTKSGYRYSISKNCRWWSIPEQSAINVYCVFGRRGEEHRLSHERDGAMDLFFQ
jgi:hypothetical protein